ncbi:MAG: OsmC family peroxiredoxin [Actinomycetota bacterium]
MTTTRRAHADWEGSLLEGAGRVSLDSSGLGTFDVTWAARAEDPEGKTSPEELLAAAHAACFSMAFSSRLAKAGATPTVLHTSAEVDFQPGEGITGVRLFVTGEAPGMDAETFHVTAEDAKENCPVSQALAVPISLTVG